jgi:hypothetical protein
MLTVAHFQPSPPGYGTRSTPRSRTTDRYRERSLECLPPIERWNTSLPKLPGTDRSFDMRELSSRCIDRGRIGTDHRRTVSAGIESADPLRDRIVT